MSNADGPSRASSLSLVLVPLACAVILSPGSADRVVRLAHADPSSSFAAAFTDLCAVLATVISLWLVLTGVAVAAVGVQAPGSRWSGLVDRLAPAPWRRIVLAALGATLASTPIQSYASSPDPAARPVVAANPSPRSDLSGLRLPDRPSGHSRTPATPAADRGAIRVSAGDCLWSIAERALNADGGARAGDREIAAATRAWYLANRRAIGADPDLIRPGMSLTPPLPPDEGRSR